MYINRSIQSVLNQTVQDFEIIVIDGGSKDEGPNLVKSFKDQRIQLIQQKGRGVANARNEGIKISQTEFIAFLDADDEWMPDFLQTIVKLHNKHPYAGIFATKFYIKTKNRVTTTYENMMLPKGQWEGIITKYFLVAAISEPLTTSAIALPKHIFYEFGGFPEGINYGEDMLLWGKIALKYDIAYSNHIGAIYHLEAENRLSEIPSYRYDPYPFVKYAQKELLKNRIIDQKIEEIQEYIASKEINRAYFYYTAGKLKIAQSIAESIKTRFLISKKIKLTILLRTPLPLFIFGKKVTHYIRNYYPNFCIELMD
jgi:glycosyltransferase involved in cell wall biosynthesis